MRVGTVLYFTFRMKYCHLQYFFPFLVFFKKGNFYNCVLIMQHICFRVNLFFVSTLMSRNPLLKTSVISEI